MMTGASWFRGKSNLIAVTPCSCVASNSAKIMKHTVPITEKSLGAMIIVIEII